MYTNIYIIKTLTNLHAGSGDATYGVVDKEVQRDPVDELPVINGSSIKGALREAFANHLSPTVKKHEDRHKHPVVTKIFGRYSRNDDTKQQSGDHRFFEARLLALPVRSSHRPFYLATSPAVLQRFYDDLVLFGCDKTNYQWLKTWLKSENLVEKGVPSTTDNQADIMIDEYEMSGNLAVPEDNKLIELLGYAHIALLHDDDLKSICERLPVIARNHLENGVSSNLWYEEVVPRYSLFYNFIELPAEKAKSSAPENNDDESTILEEEKEKEENATPKEAENSFESILEKLSHRIQVGGNATVGYGQTLWTLQK